MKCQKRWTLTLSVMIVMLTVAGCSKQEKVFDRDLAGQLQAALEDVVENRATRFPGVVLHVSSPGLGTWAGAAGLGNLETETAMSPSDRFRAGSIMKTFISVVILQLVEEGRVSLDDPMPAVLPEDVASRFANRDRITVRMLMNHTGGIPNCVTDAVIAEVGANPQKVWETREWLDISAAQAPSFAPGESWAYSNTDYILLGLMIEQATGKPWREEIRRRIIEVLSLEDTSLPEPGDRSIPERHARGYHFLDTRLVDLTEVDPSMAGAAGGHALATTAADLARFLDAVLAGALFQQDETLKEMLTFVDAPNGHGVPHYYGLAIEKYVFPGGIEMIGHSGGTAGFASVVSYLPAQKMMVAATVNTQDLESVYLRVLLPALAVLNPALRGAGS